MNRDKNESYGGGISIYPISGANVQNLFDLITEAERDIGSTGPTPGLKDYRVFYIKISNQAEGEGVAGKIWMSQNTSIDALSYRIAVGPKNTTITKPGSEHIMPPGLNFIDMPETQVTGLSLPFINPGDFIPIAIERSIASTSAGLDRNGITLSIYWQSISEEILMEFNTLLASGMTNVTYGPPAALGVSDPYPDPFTSLLEVVQAWTDQGKRLFFSNNVEDGGGLRDTPILVIPTAGDATPAKDVTWTLRLWYWDRHSETWFNASGGGLVADQGPQVVYIFKPLLIPSFIEVVSVSNSGSLELRLNDVLCTVR